MTDQPRRIAVGIDGSQDADRAAAWATGWAAALGADVRVLHVLPAPPPGGTVSDAAQQGAQTHLDGLVDELRSANPGVDVTGEVTINHPVTGLLAASGESDALVVGTRGQGGWQGLTPGSVSGAVAARAKCPTVVFPAGASTTYDPSGAIVVGTDGTPTSLAAAELVLQAAQHEGRPVRVVVAEPQVEEGADAAVEDLCSRYPEVTVEVLRREEPRVDVLADASADAALVVIASHGYRGVPGFLLGSTTRELVQRASAPVLVLTRESERLWPTVQA